MIECKDASRWPIRSKPSICRAIVSLSVVLLLTGCLHRHRQATTPPSLPPPQGQLGVEGIASWYGKPYNGRPTASGEIYNMYAMTAAHRTLPFGTTVRVYDLDNGRTVEVRINDRGPFVQGRVIDLSYAAAEAMGMVGAGTAHVRIEILNPSLISGPSAVPGIYAVQVGAFREQDHAEQVKLSIEPHFGPVTVDSYQNPQLGLLYRVRVGRLTSEGTAEKLANELKQAGLVSQTYVVRLN
jgi:rare lipoprotein A